MEREVKVSVVGLGKLGAPLAAVLSSVGHTVYGIDVSQKTVDLLNAGKAPVDELGLQELIDADPFSCSTSFEAVRDTDITIIIVPTPSTEDGGFDNGYVLEALQKIGGQLRLNMRYHTVVVASTVMPGSSVSSLIPALEEASGKTVSAGLGFVFSPEFIALGSVVADLMDPDMVLVGESDKKAGDRFLELMERVVPGYSPKVRLSLTEAELTKISVNSYVTMKISFANTLAEMCENLPGVDANKVVEAVGADSRIGRKYLRPGTPYGGPCFPRDQRAFRRAATNLGLQAPLSRASDQVNDHQIMRLADLATEGLGKQDGVAVLGLSYKVGTKVTTESAGVRLLDELHYRGYAASGHFGYEDGQKEFEVYLKNFAVAVITNPEPLYKYLHGFEGRIIDCWGQNTNPDTYRIGVGQ